MRVTKKCAVLVALAAASVWAQPPVIKTNFSGRWRMIKDRSDFAKFAPPDAVIRVVEQHGSTMNVHTVETIQGKTNISDIVYYLDGRVSKNVLNGHDAESRTFWDGSDLMVRTYEKDSHNHEIEMLDRWDLSPDGRTLTTTSHIQTENGSVDMKLVSEKE
jgi:hypothetical protein